MRKIWVIAGREYRASVQTKSFLISLLFLPLMMGVSILLQNIGETQEKRFIVVDRTSIEVGQTVKKNLYFRWIEFFYKNQDKIKLPVFGQKKGDELPFTIAPAGFPGSSSGDGNKEGQPLSEQDRKKKVDEERFELSEQVRKGKINGFAEIGTRKELFLEKEGGKENQVVIRYQTNAPTYNTFPVWLTQVVTIANPMAQAGKEPPEKVEKIQSPFQKVELITKGLSEKKDGRIEEAPTESRVAPILVPIGLTMLMFLVIMVGTTPLIQGVIEEKMQRIAEVLLGSVSPFGLMMGKLLGMVGVALTLTAVYLGGGYWLLDYFGYTNYLTPGLLAWFLVFVVLAVFMFGSIFIAVGAACSDMKEAQTLLMPVMLVVMIPLFVMTNVINEPNSPLAFWMSLFPTGTPMLMVARQAIPPYLPLWQPLLGVGLVLLTTLFCVYVAGRIFRVGILMQGKGARISELVRWAIRG